MGTIITSRSPSSKHHDFASRWKLTSNVNFRGDKPLQQPFCTGLFHVVINSLGFTVSGSLSHAPGGCKHRSNQPSPHVFFFPCGGKWEFNLKCLSRQYICFFSVKTYWHCGQAACICWLARSLTSPACIDHTPLWAGPCRGAGKTAESKLHLPGVVQPTCMVWLLTASVFLGVHLRPLQLSCQYLRCQRQHIFFWGLYFILWDRWVPTRTLFNHSSSSYSSFLTLRAADLALVDSGTFLSVPCREG